VRNLALLPASVSTLIYLSAIIACALLAALPEPSPWIGLLASGSLYLFLTLWLQNAFLVAEERQPPETRRKTRSWMPFAIPLLVVLAFVAGSLPASPATSTVRPLALAASLLLYFALIHRTAVALVRAEGKVLSGTPFFNAAFVAWLALFYFPIGVWFIRPRLERLAQQARPAPAAAA
jgi:hypothetical protein